MESTSNHKLVADSNIAVPASTVIFTRPAAANASRNMVIFRCALVNVRLAAFKEHRHVKVALLDAAVQRMYNFTVDILYAN